MNPSRKNHGAPTGAYKGKGNSFAALLSPSRKARAHVGFGPGFLMGLSCLLSDFLGKRHARPVDALRPRSVTGEPPVLDTTRESTRAHTQLRRGSQHDMSSYNSGRFVIALDSNIILFSYNANGQDLNKYVLTIYQEITFLVRHGKALCYGLQACL